METSSINLPRSIRIVTEDLRERYHGLEAVDSRHQGIYGFDQEILSGIRVVIIGLGMNTETAHSAVKKGWGFIYLLDGDPVNASNLNRQLYRSQDIGRNKAIALARNLEHLGFQGTELIAIPLYFQAAVEQGYDFTPDVFVVGVDNDETRVFVARYALKRSIPVVFTAVSADANNGEVYIQEPDKSCYVCAHPEAYRNRKQPCPGTPACVDIIKVMSGLVTYSVDSVVMNRPRNWNQRVIYLAGFVPDEKRWIERRPECPLCSDHQQ